MDTGTTRFQDFVISQYGISCDTSSSLEGFFGEEHAGYPDSGHPIRQPSLTFSVKWL